MLDEDVPASLDDEEEDSAADRLRAPSEPVPTAAVPRVSTRPKGPADSVAPRSGVTSAEDTPRGLEVMGMRPPAEPVISPRMTAIFGGLFGLATVASIIALLIQVFPVVDQRSLVAEAASATAATSAEADDAPRSAPVPKRQREILPGPWRVDALKDSHRLVTGTMQRRSFISALKEEGVPTPEVYRILKAMEGVRKFDRTGKNDKFVVALERPSKRVAGFEYIIDDTEIYQAKPDDAGLLKGERLDMKVREEEFAIAFYIGKDFEKSYQRAGLEKGLGRVINEAFNGRTSVEAFEEGGVVRLVVVEKTALGRFVRYERVRAIEYRPPDPEKAPERAYWFEGQGKGGYVDEKGRKPSAQGWRSPCPGAPVTSHFNPTRLHPVLKKVMPHNGTDFGAPAGTPVYAAFRGEVSWVGMRGASGNLVLIEHPGGVQTGYAHLSRFAPSLKVGDKVGTRQLVGYVGSTGRSTGPHLHFSAKRDGKFFDALELKLDAITLLPVGDRATFMGQKQSLDQALESIPLPEPPAPEPEPQPEPDQADPDGAESPEPAEGADEGADERSDEGPDEGDEGSSDDGGDEADQGESDEGRDEPKPSSGSEDLGSDLSGPDLSGDFE